MLKFVIVIGLLAAGYWYYTGYYQHSFLVSPAQQAEDNARLMDRCMRQEASITAGAGMVGAISGGGDNEAFCAEKLNLELHDGQWMPRGL